MNHSIRTAVIGDAEQALALLPSLADFDTPQYRNPDHLWQGDAEVLKNYFKGDTPNTYALVAVDNDSKVLGIAIYTMRQELLSGEPSAHLEVLAVDGKCRRQGLGRRLLDASETAAKDKGAQSMTLHVFSNNTRARSLYTSVGFQEEMLRCFKPL